MEEIINKIFKEKYPNGLSAKYTKEEISGYMMAINDIKEQCTIPVAGSSSIDRKQAEFLWELLDDIDTAGDMFKPRDLDSWERYYSWINKKLRKRFEIFKSDGYKLMTPEEYQENNEKRNKKMIDALKRQSLRFNGGE